MLTTPFIRGGIIEKKRLDKDPNNLFDLLGLDKGVQQFKLRGQTTTIKKKSLIDKSHVP